MKPVELSARKWLAMATITAGLFCAVVILIPLAEQAGWSGASLLRLALRPACHQITERCLDLGAGPLPICARCAGLYIGGFAGLLVTLVSGRRFQLRFRWLVAAVVPSAIDFCLGLVHFPTLANWPRFTVALLPGLIAGLLLADAICHLATRRGSRRMDDELKEEKMDTKAPSMFLPALIAGGSLGFVSGLPVSNCACCLWAAGAGFLAAFLYSKNCKQAGAEFDTGKGGVLGLLTGAVFGVVGAVVNSVFSLLTGGLDTESMRQAIESNPMITDPGAADEALQIFESVGPMFFILVFALIWIIFGVLFAALGGLIGGSAFKVAAAQTETGGGWSASPPPMPPGGHEPPPPPVAPGASPREE